jgi:hypothetical protein
MGDWIRLHSVAEILGRSSDVVWNWIKYHGLPVRRDGRKPWVTTRDSLRGLALSHPHLFHHATRDALVFLLEDPAVVDAVLSTPSRYRRRVRCRDSGRVYASAAVAAAAVGVSYNAIAAAIANGHRCRGRRWEWVAEPPRNL